MENFNNGASIAEDGSKKYSLTFGNEKTSHTGLNDMYLEVEERILEAMKFGDPFIFEGENERGNLFYTVERTAEEYILSVKEITEETAELLKNTLESVKQLGKEKMQEIMEIMMFEEIDIDVKKTMILSLESDYEELIAALQTLREEANEALADNLMRLQEIISEYDDDFE